MGQPTVGALREGAEFEGVLWLVAGTVRQTKNGDPYWEGTFQDATGAIGAKLWDSSGGKSGRVKALSGTLKPASPVRLRARVDAFQGALQLTVQSASEVPPGEVDPALFSPRSRRATDEMLREFDSLVDAMADTDYKRLMEAFLADRELLARLTAAPAAKAIHHAWVGGLLEHCLSLARGVTALAPNYLCGCFFHDVGKCEEISADPGFDYTTDGRLLGHIYMGARLADQLCASVPGFPEEKRRHLVHLVLSHQGDRSEGFGSAADPATPEAVFFHHLDNLDAKLQHCLTALERADGVGPFTNPRGGAIRKSYYRVRPGGEAGAPAPAEGDDGPDDGDEDDRRDDSQPRLW
jgi:3'-5' exoribonuclease